MRGDVALTARLLLRGDGLAGLAVAAGGALAVFAATRPWYHALAEVAMLDTAQARAVDSLIGTQTLLGRVSLGVGLVAAVLGVLCAVDRPPAHARQVLLGCAVALLVTAAVAWLGPPPELARVAGSEGDELARLGGRLPDGIRLRLAVRLATGPALTALASGIVAAGTIAAREL